MVFPIKIKIPKIVFIALEPDQCGGSKRKRD